MKVEPNCSGIKGRIDSRKQRSISDPHYRSMSNFSRTTSISMFGFPRHEMQSVNEEQPRTRIEKILEPLRVESSEDAVASTIPMNLKSMSVSEVSESAYSTIRREKSFRSKRMSPAPSIMIDLVVGNPAAVMYDYFATHPEEVNIHEGEHVLVERLDDGSGWTLVSKSGLQGIVPTAYIKGLVPQASFSTLRQNSQHLDHGMAKVLYTFTKSDATELSVKEGDAIRVVQEDDGSGWIVATDGTSQGLLPANYVKTL